MPLFNLHAVDNFDLVRGVAPRNVSNQALATVRDLHEVDEIESWLQAILFDTNHTPHGPSEIVDILTHKVSVRGREGLAAFILKGRSFPTVRPPHAAHQIFRLERIEGLDFAILAASGTVLDDVKEQFVSTAVRIRADYCFLDCHDLARLFIAFGYICPRDGVKIRGGRCSCGYTPANRTSNILQQAALAELHATHNLNQSSGAVILPTASGKTRVAVLDILRTQAQLVVYVAHSHEILESAQEEFLKEFPSEQVMRFDERPVHANLRRINLITVQSLARNLDVFQGCHVNYMVVDEFHHAAAQSYRRSVDALRPAFLLGLTATPFRSDQQDVLNLCDNNIIVSYELRQGIEFGVLSPYHYYGCFDNVDYSNIRNIGVRYDVTDLERALIIPERNAAIIAKWREKSDGKPTLAFCCSQIHARRVAQSFQNEGVAAEVYLSTNSQDSRATLRAQLRAGTVKVLCVVDVLNEGVDLPFVESLLFLRPTESKRVFFQQLGRGLRRFVGKEHCVVIDFIGNFRNAYTVVENLGLEPFEQGDPATETTSVRSAKEILNLPTGCVVEFEDRVIDVFGSQTMDPRFATRQNIARILIHQYRKIERRIGHRPTKLDLDRSCVIGSRFYTMVFGSWRDFENRMTQDNQTRRV
ncbi:MAG: DEAD/DEAH box helicase [Proteobacteria bacterium]|nr:DEAD/DEAH box helicase [Pseudomonadota bacterium]